MVTVRLCHCQVSQHNQAVLSQGGRCGGDVRRHRGGELQGCAALAHQCAGLTFDPSKSSACAHFGDCSGLLVKRWPLALSGFYHLELRQNVFCVKGLHEITGLVFFRKQREKGSPSSFWATKWTWMETERCHSKRPSNWLM